MGQIMSRAEKVILDELPQLQLKVSKSCASSRSVWQKRVQPYLTFAAGGSR